MSSGLAAHTAHPSATASTFSHLRDQLFGNAIAFPSCVARRTESLTATEKERKQYVYRIHHQVSVRPQGNETPPIDFVICRFGSCSNGLPGQSACPNHWEPGSQHSLSVPRRQYQTSSRQVQHSNAG